MLVRRGWFYGLGVPGDLMEGLRYPPTPLVLPLSGVDPEAAPCLCPLLSPAGYNTPPPSDKPFVGAPEGPLSALAGSLNSGQFSPLHTHKGGGVVLASVQPSRGPPAQARGQGAAPPLPIPPQHPPAPLLQNNQYFFYLGADFGLLVPVRGGGGG